MEKEKTILRSRNIYTGKGCLLDGGVVIEGNRIQTVVPSAEAEVLRSVGRFIDYGDQTVMPAFHDAHLHLIIGALSEKGGFLRDAKSEEEAARQFYALNRERGGIKWLLGGAWDHFKWPGNPLPTRASLDRYFPEQKVFLLNKECHGAWVNSATLRHFGIGADTPDPQFGEIFRDEHGEPTGYLHESAGVMVLKQILQDISKAELSGYVDAFTQKAWSCGITAVSDMQISEITGCDIYDAMEDAGRLELRIHYAAPFSWPVERLLALKKKHAGERLRFSGTKDFVDGTPMGYTGLMLEPYLDRPGNAGSPAIDLPWMHERVRELDAAGIRTRLHACGDGAVREALDAFASARKANGRQRTRHTIEHIEACSPDDIPRFAELDVIASVQPDHLPKYDFAGHPFHRLLGPERMRWSWPFRSLQDAGAILAFGTDYPVSELTPFRGLFRAVTRLTDELEPEGGFSPAEKMILADALDACTLGSAWTNGREKDLGRLAPGYLADIVVLDRNIFAVPETDLIRTKAAATWFDGRQVL